MANPFYVRPLGGVDLATPLAGLGNILETNREETLRQAQMQEAQQAIRAAIQSGDPQQIAEVSIQYPQFREVIESTMNIAQEGQRNDLKTFSESILANPGNARELTLNRLQMLQSQGRDTSQTQSFLQELTQDPESAIQNVERLYALQNPESYNAFAKTRPSLSGEAQSLHERALLSNRPEGSQEYFDFIAYGGPPPEIDRERAEDANGVLRYVDTGEAVFPETEEVAKTIANDKDLFDKASKIRAEISKETKDYVQVENAWDRIVSVAREPSAAGDLALVFNYMKLLDPGSVVRESEFKTAEDAKAWMSRLDSEGEGARIPSAIRTWIQKAETGQILLPEQRADFLNQAQNLFEAARGKADNLIESYVSLGERAGLSREDIAIDRGPRSALSEDAMNPDYTEISTQADYDALPSGALYIEIDEDGKRNAFRKP